MASDPNRTDESNCKRGQQKHGQSEIDQRLDRLYVPVKTPNGTDELLRFQWMRPHPATLMACLPDDDDEHDEIPSSAKQLSRAFPSYQASLSSVSSDDRLGAAIQEKKQKQKLYQSAEYESSGGNEQRNHQTENASPQHESLLQATGVKVDLCDFLLLEPPSLSPVTEKIVESMQGTGNSET